MLKAHLWALISSLMLTFSGYAEEMGVAKQPANTLSYANVLQWILALLFVLALFALLVWLLRKTGNLTLTGKNELSIVTGLSVGVREKLVLVKVGEKQLLLGVTPGRIDKLLELEGDSRLFQDQLPIDNAAAFAKTLQRMLQAGKADA
ncbi:MAG: flagellar biosynthetic protein FliO [Methylomonas sp.]|nr:MAG: flagellar biosynthetic protein FliO [Methylomonas sp.]